MKSDFLNLLVQYKKEIAAAIIAGGAALLFSRALPAVLSSLRDGGSYLLALMSGHRAEYRFEKKYLSWLINENKFLMNVPSQLVPAEHLPKQPELESIFITLHLRRSNDAPVELPISELVKPGAKTVILGDPGSGKTTQLRFFCLTFARLAKTPVFYYRVRKTLTSRFQAKRRRIPILIYLNRLTETDNNLLSVAERLLPESLAAIYPSNYFQRLVEDGKCIFLLDGLDEVPTMSLRKRIAEAIGSLSNATNERNSWIVSSRIVGYTQLHNSFDTAIVKPLTAAQVESFVDNWYRIKCDTSGFSDVELANQRKIHSQRARNLINTIRINPGVASLTTSPILVSLIALLHSVKIELPHSRPLLYRDCVELLADRWDLSRGLAINVATPISLEQKIYALVSVASHMHINRIREVSRLELERIVSSKLEGIFEFSNQVLPGRIIDDLEERSGLLINRGLTHAGEKIMSFSHLSFQEYLSARSLLSSPESNTKEMLAGYFADSWWRETILLYVAQMDSPMSLIKQIYDDSFKDKSLDKVLLAAACLSEVKLEKTSDLYVKVFSEIAFIYSCGEICQPALSTLECDGNNLLLRHMVDYLIRTTPEQVKGLHILLHVKRQIELDPDLIDSYIRQYEGVLDVVDFDLRLAKAISKYRKLPAEPVVALMLRSQGYIDISGEVLLREPITTQQLATAAMEQSDWERLMRRIVSISPHAIHADATALNGWKASTIARSISKHRANLEKLQNDHSEEDLDRMKECLSRISERDYSGAEAIYGTIGGWFKQEDVRKYEHDIDSAYNSSDVPGRRLCIMLILRIQKVDGPCADLLIDFVKHVLKSVSEGSSLRQNDNEERATQINDLTLLNKAIGSLSECRLTTDEHVRFLLQCSESSSPDVVDFAVSCIERLREVSNDAVKICSELLTSPDPARLWAAISISSSLSTPEPSFIEKLLPQLYDKDLMFRDKRIADHAAYGMLKISSIKSLESTSH